jgi:hypothetical protein
MLLMLVLWEVTSVLTFLLTVWRWDDVPGETREAKTVLAALVLMLAPAFCGAVTLLMFGRLLRFTAKGCRDLINPPSRRRLPEARVWRQR